MSSTSGGSVTSETACRVDHKVVNRPSTYVCDSFSPNPYYDKLANLYESVSGSLDFEVDISLFVDEDGELDEERYLAFMEMEYGDELDAVLESFIDTEERAPTMPPASAPAEVYSRVEECEIVDIGSGDCTKLSRCQAMGVVATDKSPQENRHFEVKQLDAEDLTDFMSQFKVEKVLTSYNVLTQLEHLDDIKLHDGIHLYPDTQFMRDHMGCELVGEKLLRSKGRKGVVYEDHIHEELERGETVTTGYKIQNYFRDERVECKTLGRVKMKGFTCPIEDVQYRLPNLAATRKYDGICMMLMINAGVGWLKMRNGYGIALESERKISTLLLVEKLPKVGKPEAFVLLRVLKHKSWYPYHGLSTLENYCSAVKLTIDGVRIVPPGDTRLDDYAYDGYIYRSQEVDFRFKEKVTVDIVNICTLIVDLEEQYGLDCHYTGLPTNAVMEYEIKREGDRYKFCPLSVRKDKTFEQQTPIEKIVRMIRWL